MTAGWIGFAIFVLVMLVLDLGVFHRKAHEIRMREALLTTGMWVTLALLFCLGIWLGWVGSFGPAARGQKALEFLTGYLIEQSLSVDNVFVFALLFHYFHVKPHYRHRVLFWGILGALIMRAIFIFAGIALLQTFHWLIYVFGLILVVSGIKMWNTTEPSIDPDHNPVLRFVRRLFPVATGDHGQKFFVRQGSTLMATPLFIVLVFIEWSDLVFALDSIPAILAVTHDPFIVYTSNIFAILGLRSLYFALANVMQRFHLLHYGLSAILVFVGAKMLIAEFYHVPILLSLGVIVTILTISVVASLLRPPPADSPDKIAAEEAEQT